MRPHLSSLRPLFLRAPLCALLLLLVPASGEESLAAEYVFTSKTYVKFYEDPRENKYAPLYERIELEGKGLHDGKLSLYLSGWLGYDFSTLSNVPIVTVFQAAFLSW